MIHIQADYGCLAMVLLCVGLYVLALAMGWA